MNLFYCHVVYFIFTSTNDFTLSYKQELSTVCLYSYGSLQLWRYKQVWMVSTSLGTDVRKLFHPSHKHIQVGTRKRGKSPPWPRKTLPINWSYHVSTVFQVLESFLDCVNLATYGLSGEKMAQFTVLKQFTDLLMAGN